MILFFIEFNLLIKFNFFNITFYDILKIFNNFKFFLKNKFY